MEHKGIHSVDSDTVPGKEIPFQPASLDIWDKKYRLRKKDGTVIDVTLDDTFARIARALADQEQSDELRQRWYEKFLWALQNGAIPAGRIISNVGANKYRPNTSTINCTVSGTIYDSMDDILQKLHEAGLTLKAGCGIGYEFSTLRPKGDYVAGAGAYTSGPLSFMDIYDRMCFTISSAGGRRGAQMATFDIRHPDVLDLICAKREDGRLRQFNLSLLITEEFMQAVADDDLWKLVFPIRESELTAEQLDLSDSENIVWHDWSVNDNYIVNKDGKVACRVHKVIPARRLWDAIMSSTYDYAEPGFILIDRVNEMNNNWFCENIRATNPCVTGDTWVHTKQRPRQVKALLGRQVQLLVDGKVHLTGVRGFFKTAEKATKILTTKEGFKLNLTADHKIRRVTRQTRFLTETEWCEVQHLKPGDKLLINNHRQHNHWTGDHTNNEGYLMGLLIGDGTLKQDKAVLSVWKQPQAVNDGLAGKSGAEAIMQRAFDASKDFATRNDFAGWTEVSGRNEYRLSFARFKALAESFDMSPGNKRIGAKIEMASSDFYRGFLQGFFDADGSVQGDQGKGVSVRLAQSDLPRLEAVQRMLLRLGINSTIYRNRRTEGITTLPDGKGGMGDYPVKAQHELVISKDNLSLFDELIGFADIEKSNKLAQSLKNYKRSFNRERFVSIVEHISDGTKQAVYDVKVPGINTFDGNGFHVHNCGEQPLPEYGACLLGSVNLTKFVVDPFSERARFDWEKFREVVRVFTRMLDNVVEIDGLPLPQQKHEILRKRRHGMGFLGLGSTLTMLRMKYGEQASLEFTEAVSRELAMTGWQVALELAKEKGPAPILEESFTVTPDMLRLRPEMREAGYKEGDQVKGAILHARYSRYMQKIKQCDPELVAELEKTGARFTHHSSIAPTGTISLSIANNASNGIEPSFAHQYSRNIIREGKKTKEKVDVFSYELLVYHHFINPQASQYAEKSEEQLPDYFVSSDDISPKQHVDIQAAAQQWIDSSISKTANVPTDYPYKDFKDIYRYAHKKGLKGCTTFRFNPEVFQGVLVKQQDLEKTIYRFVLKNGKVIEAKGNEKVEYDGEIHTAANLYDALKEGYYGKF